uniref:TPR_REGION domain-containing protein n=1 Tax=Heterorhabditis bacteriophora TaxID=37862 RepID=A0A1I7X377_HETBA
MHGCGRDSLMLPYLAILLVGIVSADLFTAIADMQNMLGAEKEVTAVIDNYIAAEQERLDELRRYTLKLVFFPFSSNIKKLLKNFAKASEISKKKQCGTSCLQSKRLLPYTILDASSIKQGKIIPIKAVENERPETMEESEILEYLAYSLYQQGNIRRALALTKRLAEIAPNHPRAKEPSQFFFWFSIFTNVVAWPSGNVKWYEDMLEGKDMEGELPPVSNKRNENDGIVEREAYEALCRGETPKINPADQRKLRCYLKVHVIFK